MDELRSPEEAGDLDAQDAIRRFNKKSMTMPHASWVEAVADAEGVTLTNRGGSVMFHLSHARLGGSREEFDAVVVILLSARFGASEFGVETKLKNNFRECERSRFAR